MRHVALSGLVVISLLPGGTLFGRSPERSTIPLVLLTEGHKKLCRLGVGESLPQVVLPQLSGEPTKLGALKGKKATVVLFWSPDRWMARTALADLTYWLESGRLQDDISVVGVAVALSPESAEAWASKAGARFPQLIDSEGLLFTQVGFQTLPRVYVLDAKGAIVWFDIEYSEATRRELRQTLDALTLR